MKLEVDANIDDEELIRQLIRQNHRDDLIDFIKSLDLAVAEYEFTEKLRDYFVEEMEKEDRGKNG